MKATTILFLSTTALISAPAFGQVESAQPLPPLDARTAPPVAAESSPAATATQIQEIVVTAERRATSAQKTPVSIEVYTGDDLIKRGITDVTQLANADSSVNITYSTGQPIVSVRGISSGNTTEIGDPAVSVATDGVFTNRPYGVFGGLYDIARVEVLRGPQGTLFGRNSTGGTLNLIDARPSKLDEAQITGEAGNYNLIAFNGYANAVVTDWLQARMSFNFRSRDGYRDNSPADARGDDDDTKSARFQLAFQPTDRLSGWVLAQYLDQRGAGAVQENIPFAYVNGVSGEPIHGFPSTMSDGKSFPLYSEPRTRLHSTDVRGSLSYRVTDDITLTYLGGYNKINYLRVQALNGAQYGEPTARNFYHAHEAPETINQELRLSSAPDAIFTWQLGAYYFHEKNTVSSYTELDSPTLGDQRGVLFDYPKVTATSKAVFGQAGYQFTDKLKISAGARYTWDDKARVGTFFVYPLATGLPFTIPIDNTGSAKFSKATWTAGVDYQATSRNLLYAKVSTGYKAGGFNDATSTYGPETVTAYELGSKNRFLNNHLQINLAFFWMDYANQQVTQFVSGATSSGSLTTNAGKSRNYGVESNIVYQDDAFGRAELSANYTHARYRQFVTSAGWDTSINLDLTGNRLPLAPTWSFVGQYERPIELSSGATITPRASVKYESRKYFSANNFENTSQKPYALTDLGIDYSPASHNWTLQAYVKNAFNKKVFLDASEVYLNYFYSYSYMPPRTFGARLTVNFK